jgi:hypothetical protein
MPPVLFVNLPQYHVPPSMASLLVAQCPPGFNATLKSMCESLMTNIT